jgi:hypothetical protein
MIPNNVVPELPAPTMNVGSFSFISWRRDATLPVLSRMGHSSDEQDVRETAAILMSTSSTWLRRGSVVMTIWWIGL